ncbi:MAG TPA: carbohydrate kinase family protein [Acidobacteriaceae bacterium]|nr:carbohydrate kinase family protein [Acidobacteriaceae bacterium]
MTQLSKVDVVGVGLNATDTLISLLEFPERGSKTEYETESLMPGGQVASTVVACQTWGLSTRYVGKLGDDHAAALHADAFKKVGVETQIVTVAKAPSARSLILVDRHGERTVLCRRDERVTLQPGELRREWIENARVLHVDGHDTAAATLAARWARAAGIPVVADLDDTYPGVEALIENVDYLIANSDFPCRLTGEENLDAALRQIQLRYGCRVTAATLGPDGILAWDGNRFHHAAAYQVPVVDTTGAGDIFRAGFIFGLLRGWPLQRQLDFACAAGAMNCMGEGARGGIATVAAIEALMAATPRYRSMPDLATFDVAPANDFGVLQGDPAAT